jgi:hypothetical protein
VNAFMPSNAFISSKNGSFSVNSPISEIISRTQDPFSANLGNSPLCSLSPSIAETLFGDLDETDPFSPAREKGPTNLDGFSLIAFSRVCSSATGDETSVQISYGTQAGAKSSEDSAAKVGTIAISVGGAIGGLLAVMASVALVIVMNRKKRRSEEIEEDECGSETGIDMDETMAAFYASDHYASQDNSDDSFSDEDPDHTSTGDRLLVFE